MCLQALSGAERMGAGQNMPLGLMPESFHPINGGVDFDYSYRLGMRGPFENQLLTLSTWDKAVWRFKRWRLHKLNLLARTFRRKQQYFVLWR